MRTAFTFVFISRHDCFKYNKNWNLTQEFTQRSRRYKDHKEGSKIFVRYITVNMIFHFGMSCSPIQLGVFAKGRKLRL